MKSRGKCWVRLLLRRLSSFPSASAHSRLVLLRSTAVVVNRLRLRLGMMSMLWIVLKVLGRSSLSRICRLTTLTNLGSSITGGGNRCLRRRWRGRLLNGRQTDSRLLQCRLKVVCLDSEIDLLDIFFLFDHQIALFVCESGMIYGQREQKQNLIEERIYGDIFWNIYIVDGVYQVFSCYLFADKVVRYR